LFLETKKIFSGLFWCFGPVSKQPKQTELFPKTETNRKNLQKTVSSRVPSQQLIFFRFERKETETQSVSIVFWFVSQKQKKIGLFLCFGLVSKQPKQTECMVWGILVYILKKVAVILVVSKH
jgi:hypothetical protein